MFNVTIFGSESDFSLKKLISYSKKEKHFKINSIISNKKESDFYKSSKKLFPKTFFVSHEKLSRKEFEKKLLKKIPKKTNIILLLHFSRKLTNFFLKKCNVIVINVHPSLLPKHSKLFFHNVFESVLNSKDSVSGITLHLVNEKLDEGPILLQKSFKLSKKETLKSLQKKSEKTELELLRAFFQV